MKKAIYWIVIHLSRMLGGRGFGLRKIPGIMSLYSRLYAKAAPVGLFLVEVEGSRMYVHTEDEPLGRSLITLGSYERYETNLFKSMLTPGMKVIDVGANVGYYTLIAARAVGPTGRVFAFEPDPGNYELLLRNIELNGYRNIVASQCAVTGEASQIRLYIDKKNFGNRSLSPTVSYRTEDQFSCKHLVLMIFGLQHLLKQTFTL